MIQRMGRFEDGRERPKSRFILDHELRTTPRAKLRQLLPYVR